MVGGDVGCCGRGWLVMQQIRLRRPLEGFVGLCIVPAAVLHSDPSSARWSSTGMPGKHRLR
jgi:hypothetical protein